MHQMKGGIDVIRQKVKDFARTKALEMVPFKVIFLMKQMLLQKKHSKLSAEPWKTLPTPAVSFFHAIIKAQ